jgi:ribosome production factor 2
MAAFHAESVNIHKMLGHFAMDQPFQNLYRRIKSTKNARIRRILQERMPTLEETLKTPMIIRGASTSISVREFLDDVAALKKPYCKVFSRRNQISPFLPNGQEQLEFLSQKNDCSLFLFGQDLKKRPDTFVFGRFFSYQLTEMIELSMRSYQPMLQFKEV